MGRRLRHQDMLARTALAGDVSESQFATISDAVKMNPFAEEKLLAATKDHSLAELKDLCAAVKREVTDPDERRWTIHSQRHFRCYTDTDGMRHLKAGANPEQLALLEAVIHQRHQKAFDEARKERRGEPFEAYGFDSFISVFDDALATARSEYATATGSTAVRLADRSYTGGPERFAVGEETPPICFPPADASPANTSPKSARLAGNGTASLGGRPLGTVRLASVSTVHDSSADRPGTDNRGRRDAHTPSGISTTANAAPPASSTGSPAGDDGALCSLASTSGSRQAFSPQGGTIRALASRTKIIVRVDYAAIVRGRVKEGEVCEIAWVGPISPSVAKELIDTGDPFLAAVLTRAEEVHSVVRLGRRPTTKQQTALEWTYPTYAARGCSSTMLLEVGHRTPWADSHVTVLSELNRLCSYHHDLKTRENWSLVEGKGKRDFVSGNDPHHPENCRQVRLSQVEKPLLPATRSRPTENRPARK